MDSAKESLLEAKKFETSIDNIKAQILTAEKGNADREAKLKKLKSINKKLKDLERKGWSRIVDIEDAGNELVEFEKAYDSVRWDYLDDVLKKFGFGERWCGWIQGCLKSSRGSVIVNGSPTKEFQFYKGLKQGDPLSPFLFILVMESLHISFQRVVDAGMFKGISLGSSLQLSHMFYADDAVFVGQWSDSNIDIIVHVRKWRLMSSIHRGMRLLTRVVARLSKWKMMSLSIGGKTNASYVGSWINAIYNIGLDSSFCRAPKGRVKQLQLAAMLVNLEGVSLVNIRDRWRWSLEGSREFSVASVRKLIDDKTLSEVSVKSRWVKVLFLQRLTFWHGK
ncbi:RNA-directed DNA polymerase, eukaryota [Tanacetum coccineum]